jgi:hypothetical protein
MKVILLLAALSGTASVASAQTVTSTPSRPGTIIEVGVFGLAPNIGLQLEKRLAPHFTLGVQAARYYKGSYRGYQAALLGRYYFQGQAPGGLYGQGQVGIYNHEGEIEAQMPGFHDRSRTTLKGVGAGVGIGYQLLFGPQKRLVANAALGLKFYFIKNLGLCDCSYVGDWYSVGQPGSLLDGQFGVGYAF